MTSMLPTEMAAVTPVQSETTQAEWEEVQSIISQYYGEWNEPDTEGVLNTRIPNTALLGNGDVGLASAGNDSIKQFLISKSDFWEYNGNPTYSKYGSPLLIGTYSIAEAGSQSTVNLARTCSRVTASSYYNEPDNGIYFPPEYAVDGQLGDSSNAGYRAWVSGVCKDINWDDYKAQGNRYIATGDAPEWLQLEFDEPISFNRWVLTNDSYTRGVSSFDTRDCQIMISDDGESWTTVSELKGNTRPIVEVKMNKTATAKFVRLNITNPGYDPRARVAEFELYCDKTVGTIQNLSRTYEEVTASSFYEYEPEGCYFPAEYAVDGQLGDSSNAGYRAWVSDVCKDINWADYKAQGNKYIATGEAPEWLQLKFAEPISFNRWVLTNDSLTRGAPSYDTRDCQIMISDDGESWTTVSELKGNTLPVVEVKMDKTVTAKYVRLNITNPGYDPRARVAEFELYCDAENTDTYFYEKEDILNAEVYTEMKLGGQIVNMKTYMAATDNIIVTELSGVEKAVDLQLNLAPNSGGSDIRPITVAANDDGSITITRQTALNDENMPADDLVQSVPYSSKAAVTSKIIGADSAANIVGDSAELVFTLEPGKTVYLVTAIGGGGQTYDADGNLWEGRAEPEADAAALLARYNTADDIAALHEAHLNWWKEYWLQSYISLDTSNEDLAAIQKYYYAAQYMLGCSVREDNVAAGLYGIWHANDNASWHSDYHLNYNFISTFYGLATSNRVSMLLPATKALLDYVPQGIANAASTEQLRYIFDEFVDELIERGQVDEENGISDAIVFPVAIGPYGMTIESNAYWQETADAAYSIYPLIEYYNYTLDEEFLEESLYPYIKLVLNFLEHWAIKNDDGTYTIYAGFCEGSGTGDRCSWSKDPAFELTGYKSCLRYGIEFSKKFDDGNWEKWEEIYNGLADQPIATINGKKVLGFAYEGYKNNAWYSMDSYMNYNAIPLDSIIPGEIYGYYSSAEDLQLLYNTVQWYSDQGTWNVTNNFPRIFTYAINSRYPASIVVKKMAAVIREQMQANLMIDDQMHGIEKAGATEAVNNMMLLSDQGVIKLFGNWLEDTDAKFVRLRAPGALVFSAEYDGETNEAVEGVTMYSEAGASATVASLWDEGMIVLDSNGKRVPTTIGAAPNHEEEITYTFDTIAGETYTLKKGALLSDITLDKDTVDLLVGESTTLTASVSDGGSAEDIEWSSDDESIVTVENGIITAVAVGTAIITAKIIGSTKKAACTVSVKQATDFSALSDAVRDAKSLNADDYTASSWVELARALEDAETFLNNAEAAQADVDAALLSLQKAIDNLKKASDAIIPILPGLIEDKTDEPEENPDPIMFSDVSESDWFYDDVKYVYENGIMNGVGDNMFAPDATLTRGMVVTILYRMESEPSVEYSSLFSDVEIDRWYTKGVEWAAEQGIVMGYGGQLYGPDDPVTREQLVTILCRYAQYKNYVISNGAELASYADVSDISEYAVLAVKWAVAEELIGDDNGKLLPTQNATRAEVAHAITGFSKNIAK